MIGKPSRTLFLLFFITSLVLGCANRGTPSGGDKDEDPPVIKRVNPENFSTQFSGDEIEIEFDEFVKIKNAQKQLIISPPLDNQPSIYPLGGASKTITIKIKDTLKPNTTYAFNFGESIVDNNEENPYPYFRYVFSTGDAIDSLSVKGYVVDALEEEPDKFVSVMLYEVDSTYTDSIVFKEKPRYITNTLDSLTSFSVDNIKAGTYKLIALKDQSNNYTFDQKQDKIAFIEDYVTVPTDSVYELKLFKEVVNFKAIKPKQENGKKIIFPYEGSYEDMRIKILGDTPEGFDSKITKDPKTDTLYYWYKPEFEVDTTLFVVSHKTAIDTFKHRFRNLERDSLQISALYSSILNFDQDFTLETTTPIVSIDSSKITIIDKDSLAVSFKTEVDTLLNRIALKIEKEEGQKYELTMLPNTFMDFYDETNSDTLIYSFRTKMKSEYGNIRVNLRNAKFPLIVQLCNTNGLVLYEKYTTSSPVVDFTDVVPKQYKLRVIFDTNENRKYDPGDFLRGVQPERVSYAPKIDEVRANFDLIVEFNLLD
jgi:uncharacterized protein (DUF2141 family)